MESSPTAALQKKQLKYITAAVEREIDSMEMKLWSTALSFYK